LRRFKQPICRANAKGREAGRIAVNARPMGPAEIADAPVHRFDVA
jgi:hypothetical protein